MNMPFIWLIVVVLTAIVEACTINLVSIWFTIGALVALLLAYFNLSIVWQVIAFVIVSLICILITRPLAKKYLRGNIVKTNVDRVIGKTALVTKAITPDAPGEVKVLGNFWSAISMDDKKTIPAGEHVEIQAIDGVKLIVKHQA